MKALKQLAIILALLFIIFEFYLFPFPFVKSKLESSYVIKNIGSDTTLRFKKFEDILGYKVRSGALGMAGFPFSIKAIGNIDSESAIYLKFVGYPGKVYSYVIPKGKIDTIFRGELYEDECEIVYSHGNAKNGDLQIRFELGRQKK